MATPAPSLRPLSVGEILDAGIKVVLRNWKTLIGATLVLMAPFGFFYVLAIASIDPEQLELFPEDTQSEPELPAASVFVGLGVTYILGILALLVCFGACYKVVSDSWLGKRTDVRETLSYGLRRAPMIFLLGLITFLFTLVAWIPCCVPLVWLGVAWCLSFPALLFEKIGPLKALGRSYRLTQGRWWATLGLLLIAYLLVSVISGIIQFPLLILAEVVAPENALANGLAQGVGSTIGFAITYPYVIAIVTILYFDQRVRKEGLDLLLMAEGLGVDPDPSRALAAPYVAPAPYGPPPPAYQPPPLPPWSSQAGWTAPQPGDRPASESPWMTPSPEPPPGRWAPPTGEPQPPMRPEEKPEPKDDDEPPQWPPRDQPRGPEGL